LSVGSTGEDMLDQDLKEYRRASNAVEEASVMSPKASLKYEESHALAIARLMLWSYA
jgi:hypothetical protein